MKFNSTLQSLSRTMTQSLSHKGFRRYAANTSWLFAEKIFRMFIGLFVGIWIARYLGPEKFGLLSYAQSFVGLFTAIATLGLDGIVVRELVKDESRRDELLGTAFWLKLMGALAVLFILAIAVNFTSNDSYTNTLVFIIASATIFQSFNVIDLYFQANVMGKFITYANTVSLFLSSVVKVVLILFEAPLVAFAWAVVFDSVVLAMGYLYFYIKNDSKFNILNWRFNKQTAISLLKDSWPLILSGIVILIYMRIDQVMIKEIMNAEAVGQYAAAVRISESWYFIPTVIASSLFPAIINAKKVSEELYYARLQKLYALMEWIAIAIALPMTFLSDWVIYLLYGKQYSQAGSVLMIHIWTGVFVASGVVTGRVVVINNKQVNGLIATVFGAVSNITLNLLMIPKYGLQGAAIAMMLAQIVSGFIIPIWFKVDIKYPWIAIKSLLSLGK